MLMLTPSFSFRSLKKEVVFDRFRYLKFIFVNGATLVECTTLCVSHGQEGD